MGGRGSLFLVLGFSIIFMVAGRNFNSVATQTIDNYNKYFYKTQCRYLANTGVNVINNKLWKNAALPDQTYTFSFAGGTIVDSLVTTDAVRNIKKIVSTGTITLGDGTVYSSTTKVIVQPSLFSKFAYFSNDETPGGTTIYWTTKDTVFGPMHTNDNLNVSGNPVFEGDVSIGGSLKKANSSDQPQFWSNFENNVQISIPDTGVSHVSRYASGGAQFTGHSLVYFEFRGDSVRYRSATSGTGSTWTYKLASTFAPNGVIYFQNAEVHVLGTVKGRYSLAVDGTTGNQGSFYIDDNIVYNTDPQTNPNSTDMLGLLALNNVWITDNTANNNNVNIDAAIYCQTGSFGAQDYSTRPAAGFINLVGGITQATRGAVGTIGYNGSIATGFSKRYRYDNRLLSTYPPYYVGCGSYEIVSWFE